MSVEEFLRIKNNEAFLYSFLYLKRHKRRHGKFYNKIKQFKRICKAKSEKATIVHATQLGFEADSLKIHQVTKKTSIYSISLGEGNTDFKQMLKKKKRLI